MGSSPNFRGASALLRGSSRAFSPKRASRDAPSVCLTGEGSPTPPRRPHPGKLGATSFFLNLKFYSIFFKKLRFPKAVRQRKFGFQPKLPGRKRPSSGVFSGFQPEARFARRPLSLPCGRGVGDPSPQAPPRQDGSDFLFSQPKVLLNFFKKLRFPKAGPLVAHRTASRSEAFRSATAEGGSWRGDRAKYFIL